MNKRIKKKRKEALYRTIISKLSVTPINPDGVMVIQLDYSEFSLDDFDNLGEILTEINERGIRTYALDSRYDLYTLENKQELIALFEEQIRILKGE